MARGGNTFTDNTIFSFRIVFIIEWLSSEMYKYSFILYISDIKLV